MKAKKVIETTKLETSSILSGGTLDKTQNMPVSKLAAVEMAAPVMAHCTICSCVVFSVAIARTAPVAAPATALFFCKPSKTPESTYLLGDDNAMMHRWWVVKIPSHELLELP